MARSKTPSVWKEWREASDYEEDIDPDVEDELNREDEGSESADQDDPNDSDDLDGVEEPNNRSDSDASDEGDLKGYQKLVASAPSPEPLEVSLDHAIDTAPTVVLRALLREVAQNYDVARGHIERRLIAPIDGSGTRKRKAIETCLFCEEVYQVRMNKPGGCTYRSGTKAVDDRHELWCDMYSDPWDFENELGYEEELYWTCCSKAINMPGCVLTRHTPAKDGKRLRR